MDQPRFNAVVAELLRETADLLHQQDANPFRVNAYRRAAETIEALDEDVGEIVRREGPDGLVRLPFVGRGIAGAVAEIVSTGRLSRLERLRGTLEPEDLFQTIPGIGPDLARAIHDTLHVDTLETLEVAAHDGRLEQVAGIGPRRAAAIRASLASLLSRARPGGRQRVDGPGVGLLLAVDREYRSKARAGKLSKIAPRRFNPENEAWLPVLHTHRGSWHFTALFSNTARAHQLGRTRDWVVVYFYDGDHREGQRTIVTETRGPLQGRRVIRGREAECRRYYRRGRAARGGAS